MREHFKWLTVFLLWAVVLCWTVSAIAEEDVPVLDGEWSDKTFVERELVEGVVVHACLNRSALTTFVIVWSSHGKEKADAYWDGRVALGECMKFAVFEHIYRENDAFAKNPNAPQEFFVHKILKFNRYWWAFKGAQTVGIVVIPTGAAI